MMKIILILTLFSCNFCFAQNKTQTKEQQISAEGYIQTVDNLTLAAANALTKQVIKTASGLNKNVSIAILDAFGNIVLLSKGDGVGPHNTEAARRKAYTALSTKTNTLLLLRNVALNPDTKNLNTLPELLLLSGGTPIFYKNAIIGSVGVAGGGSAENDDLIAKSANLPDQGITTINNNR